MNLPAPLPVRSVLVLTKHRFIGDTIVAVPLLRAVRRVYPHAHITLLTGQAAAVALRECPFVDEMLTHGDPRTRERTFAGSARLSLSLWNSMTRLRRTRRPDVCLLPDRSFRSAFAAWLAGGRLRAGFDCEGRGRLLTHPVPYDGDRSEIQCCLDILRAVELEENPANSGVAIHENTDLFGDGTPQLWMTSGERQRGAEILREYEAGLGYMPLVGIQAGASELRKQWPTERFADVADALRRQGAQIVLLGSGKEETERSRRVRDAIGDENIVDVTGKTSLRETMGVVSHLSLFVGNDTGVMHIAASLGVPTVALFGPTNAHKWGHIGVCNRVVAADGGDMNRIETDSVVEASRALLLLPGVVASQTRIVPAAALPMSRAVANESLPVAPVAAAVARGLER